MRKLVFATIAAASFVTGPAFGNIIIAPGGAGNAQGPGPLTFYGSTGSRSQQIYSNTFFSGPVDITAISFRAFPGAAPSGFFSNTVNVSNILIRATTTGLSGTEASGLQPSTNFAANLGLSSTTVYSGALTLTTAATGAGPQPFDYTINFSTPFAYNPGAGNLLLDFLIPQGATVSGNGFGFLTFDNANTNNDGVRSVSSIFNGSSATGTLGTDAAITAFTTRAIAAVPEPATWAMMISGFAIVGASLRGRRSMQAYAAA
jgi:hypothetical protein